MYMLDSSAMKTLITPRAFDIIGHAVKYLVIISKSVVEI